MSSGKNSGDAGGASLDDRLKRLEAIVAELESGGAPLEQAIERYQEGVTILKECRAVLAVYRRRVEELSQNADESVHDYDGDPDVAAGTAGTSAPRARKEKS
jgi:exodeoxyribonuclease VII small subunit